MTTLCSRYPANKQSDLRSDDSTSDKGTFKKASHDAHLDRFLRTEDEEKIVEALAIVDSLSDALQPEKPAEHHHEEAGADTGDNSRSSKLASEQICVLQQEKEETGNQLKELERILEETRRDNDVLKMKAMIATGNLKIQVDSLEEDKQFLVEKCMTLERKVSGLQAENDSKQKIIDKLEGCRAANEDNQRCRSCDDRENIFVELGKNQVQPIRKSRERRRIQRRGSNRTGVGCESNRTVVGKGCSYTFQHIPLIAKRELVFGLTGTSCLGSHFLGCVIYILLLGARATGLTK